MEFLHLQSQQLTHLQYLNLQLLQMNAEEMRHYIEEVALSNPVIDVSQDSHTYVQIKQAPHEIRATRANGEDEYDSFATIATDGGLEMTLERFLLMQIDSAKTDAHTFQTMQTIIAHLDESGYLRDEIASIANAAHTTEEKVLACLKQLQKLEPCGVCARDLAECLELQLRQQENTFLAIQIVRTQLHLLSRHCYHQIAKNLSVSKEDVYAAVAQIKSTNPRPGSAFCKESDVVFIHPDIYVSEEDGNLVILSEHAEAKLFSINPYYKTLLQKSDDPEIRSYLSAKMQQAETIQAAVRRRWDTIFRCAQAIVSAQELFFRGKTTELSQLRMSDIGDALGMNESTISRALRGKYLQCRYGVFPMNYFFSREAPAVSEGTRLSRSAALILIKEVISKEDPNHPLSDQQICMILERRGYSFSRRTVAKYRTELKIPGTSGRKQQAFMLRN